MLRGKSEHLREKLSTFGGAEQIEDTAISSQSFVPESLLVPAEPYSCPSLGVGTSKKNGHELENGARVSSPEDRQESPKAASEMDGGLRENLAAFAMDSAAGQRPITDDEEGL